MGAKHAAEGIDEPLGCSMDDRIVQVRKPERRSKFRYRSRDTIHLIALSLIVLEIVSLVRLWFDKLATNGRGRMKTQSINVRIPSMFA
jgi:hypothetical protein